MFNKNDVAFIKKGNDGSTYTEYYQTSLYWDENKNVSLHIYKCNWNGYNYEVCYWSNNWKDSVRKKRSVLVKNKKDALTVLYDIFQKHNLELTGEDFIQQLYGRITILIF